MGVKLGHLTEDDQEANTDAAQKYHTSFTNQFQVYLLPVAGQSRTSNAWQCRVLCM